MANLKAKFTCNCVEDYGTAKNVKLTPVTSGSEENKTFSMYTPSGNLTLNITNPAAMDFFKPGQEYYLDITPAIAASESAE